MDDSGVINLQELYRRMLYYDVRNAVNRCFSATAGPKSHTVKDGSRLSEQWDELMSGVNERHGARSA